MRCPDCNKFVSMENGDLEVDELSIDVDGTVSVSASLPRNCAECSTELKRGEFQTEDDAGISEAELECKFSKAPALTADDVSPHSFEIEELSNDVSESGGGRYAKNMVGFDLEYEVTCTNEECDLKVKGAIGDAMQASSFDESV